VSRAKLEARVSEGDLPSRIEEVREQLPETIGAMVRFVTDNPRQCAVTLGGMIVLDKILINLVRPRTAIEALAVMAVAPLLSAAVMKKAMDSGIIDFQVRDCHGCLVSLSEMRKELRDMKSADAPGEV
jgi:hypothetical protein